MTSPFSFGPHQDHALDALRQAGRVMLCGRALMAPQHLARALAHSTPGPHLWLGPNGPPFDPHAATVVIATDIDQWSAKALLALHAHLDHDPQLAWILTSGTLVQPPSWMPLIQLTPLDPESSATCLGHWLRDFGIPHPPTPHQLTHLVTLGGGELAVLWHLAWQTMMWGIGRMCQLASLKELVALDPALEALLHALQPHKPLLEAAGELGDSFDLDTLGALTGASATDLFTLRASCAIDPHWGQEDGLRFSLSPWIKAWLGRDQALTPKHVAHHGPGRRHEPLTRPSFAPSQGGLDGGESSDAKQAPPSSITLQTHVSLSLDSAAFPPPSEPHPPQTAWPPGQRRLGVEALEFALHAHQSKGDAHGEAMARLGLGQMTAHQGEMADALAHTREALMVCRRIGNTGGEGRALFALGLHFYDQGALAMAKTHCASALLVLEEAGERRQAMLAKCALAALNQALGESENRELTHLFLPQQVDQGEDTLAQARMLYDRLGLMYHTLRTDRHPLLKIPQPDELLTPARLVSTLFGALRQHTALIVAPGGRAFCRGQGAPWVSLEHYESQRNILNALVLAHLQGVEVVSKEALGQAGWPEEQGSPAGAFGRRVSTALQALEGAGLKGALRAREGGVSLVPGSCVWWHEAPD